MDNFNILGITPKSSNKKIIKAWYNLGTKQQSKDLEAFTKAILDPFYKDTLLKYPTKMKEAGFFNDLSNVNGLKLNLNLFSTPIHKILSNIKKNKNNKPPIVILNTGSYAPIHIGHLNMMEQSKIALSEQYNVVGGYLSPSHDKYVSTKYNNSVNIHSEERIYLCEEVVADSDWLMVDPWEARYNNYPINFTDVIIRLEQYLLKYTQQHIKIAYVFGSDNAEFTLAFIKNGTCVCNKRKGYEDNFNLVKNNYLLDNNRHLFIDTEHPNISSSIIRKGDSTFLPKSIINKFIRLNVLEDENIAKNTTDINSKEKPLYLVRDDIEIALKIGGDNENLLQNNINPINNFKQHFIKTLSKTFNDNIDVILLDINEQQKLVNNIQNPFINLDLITSENQKNNQKTLQVSRIFELSDGQVKPSSLQNRPHFNTITEQLKLITPGTYSIADDDIVTGNTINNVKKMLPKNVIINDNISITQLHLDSKKIHNNIYDIVDIRDFIVGGKHSGLVVNLPNGNIGRIPYLWPYISLTSRAKIPFNKQKDFNEAIWKMNYELFNTLNKNLKIKDMDQSFINFTSSLKFNNEMLITDFCLYNMECLRITNPNNIVL